MDIQATQHIQRQLIEFLRRHPDVYEEFDATTDLIERGILDSLLVTDLVLFTRQQFGIELMARDISPEKLGSIERLAAVIRKKQEKLDQAA
jgi:acyl carrier protein